MKAQEKKNPVPKDRMVDLFDDLLAFHGSQEVMSAALLKQAEDAYAHLPLGHDPSKPMAKGSSRARRERLVGEKT